MTMADKDVQNVEEQQRLDSILRRKSKFKSSPLRFSYQSFSQRITASKCSSLRSSPMSDIDGLTPISQIESPSTSSPKSSPSGSPWMARISVSNARQMLEQR